MVMDSSNRIEAHMTMEERYEALSLVFKNDEKLTNKILLKIDKVKEKTDMNPLICERFSKEREDAHTIMIEFHDDVHRVGGGFFTELLRELKIDKCEKDI